MSDERNIEILVCPKCAHDRFEVYMRVARSHRHPRCGGNGPGPIGKCLECGIRICLRPTCILSWSPLEWEMSERAFLGVRCTCSCGEANLQAVFRSDVKCPSCGEDGPLVTCPSCHETRCLRPMCARAPFFEKILVEHIRDHVKECEICAAAGLEAWDTGTIRALSPQDVCEDVADLLKLLDEDQRFDIAGRVKKEDTGDPRTLEESPFYRRPVLKRPEEIGSERLTVALHLLVKNGESCVLRLLENVGQYIDEVVCVINDTTDQTKAIVENWCLTAGKRCDVTEVTRESHSDLYILDVEETYKVGKPLIGEDFGGPFTGQPILANWSACRNLAWSRCTADWRLFLDVDDIVVDPYAIPGLCLELSKQGADMALTRYEWNVDKELRAKGSSYRERLSRNVDHIRWVYPIHEVLHGSARRAFVDGNLLVKDMRDNKGDGIRIPGRNFKILYHYARSKDWDISPRFLLQLAEAAGVNMPAFGRAALDLYLSRSDWPEERAWAWCLLGESFEREEEWHRASECYATALAEHPSAKAAFRLCRSRFREGRWHDCIASYQEGMAHSKIIQLLDDGPLYADMSKMLVAAAYAELGERDKALDFCEAALAIWPKNAALLAMKDGLEQQGPEAV